MTLNFLDNHGLVNINENAKFNPDLITSSSTITEKQKYLVDAIQLNPNVKDSLAYKYNRLYENRKTDITYEINPDFVSDQFGFMEEKNGVIFLHIEIVLKDIPTPQIPYLVAYCKYKPYLDWTDNVLTDTGIVVNARLETDGYVYIYPRQPILNGDVLRINPTYLISNSSERIP